VAPQPARKANTARHDINLFTAALNPLSISGKGPQNFIFSPNAEKAV
jgi:hypothetical protein